MALEVGIVGPAGSGKTALFTALTKAGGGDYGKTNLGVAPIADDRLGALAQIVKARKVTPATIRVQDVAGTGAAMLGNLRQVEALLVVVAGFGPGADPDCDLETFKLELIVADVDHVQKRLERVEKQAKSGDAKLRLELDERIDGIEADVERCRVFAESSPSIVTPLNTYIGYEAAAKVAKQSLAENKTIRQVVLENGYVTDGLLTEAQLDEALDVLAMTRRPV